jgi:trypsin
MLLAVVAVVAALLVSLIVLIAGGKPSQAIVGGTPAQNGKYPFMVAVLYNWKPGQPPLDYLRCGGTLIDADSVLTAAHCFRKLNLNGADFRRIDVIVGATRLGVGQGVVRDPARIAIPSGFDMNENSKDNRYDVAVTNLNQPVTNPKKINLATASQDYLETPAREATVAGWGDTSPGGSASLEQRLREVNIQIRGDSGAKNIYDLSDLLGRFKFYPDLMVAAGAWGTRDEGKGGCSGDSGGPLFDKDKQGRYTQIGILSFSPCGKRVYVLPDAYTEVNNPSIRSFITSTASQ